MEIYILFISDNLVMMEKERATECTACYSSFTLCNHSSFCTNYM